ncbi:TetR/AcrR family transcriptional regulator [Alcaligenes sp. SDU_A2]|uniref:TetR/AcrR family transcriptional regulator n=1 Tax=Alcaligenes sp. SDU_A2 TaxID=3136634 RepID=UPI00311DDCEA
MTETKTRSGPGRPRTITSERIIQAGTELGLRHITFTGLAAKLKVSHIALYKHVSGLEALKRLVADAIFLRWPFPDPEQGTLSDLEQYLHTLSASFQALIKTHPGLSPYLLRRAAASPAMLEKIAAHQARVAHAYALPPASARWALATLAFHAIAVADAVYAFIDDPALRHPDDSQDQVEIETELASGMAALVSGIIARLDHDLDKTPGKPSATTTQ